MASRRDAATTQHCAGIISRGGSTGWASGCYRVSSLVDSPAEVGCAIRMGGQIGNVLDASQADWHSHRIEGRQQPLRCLLAGRIAVEHEVDPLVLPQGLDHPGPNVGTEKRQRRHSPLLQGQPVEDALDDANGPLSRCRFPPEESPGAWQPQILRARATIDFAADEPDGATVSDLRYDDASGHQLVTAATEEPDPKRRLDWNASPAKVRNQLITRRIPNSASLERLPPKSSPFDVGQSTGV